MCRLDTPTATYDVRAPEPALGPRPQFAATTGARRLRLWEIRSNYHCPIIGTCLSTHELRRLARTIGVVGAPALSDYELHSTFVHYAGEHGFAGKQLQKQLDRKHAATLRRLAKVKDESELLTVWEKALGAGDVAGTLWAVMSHPGASDDLRHRAYQDVHMLSHQVGAANRADLRRLSELEQRDARLRSTFERLSARSAHRLAAKEALIVELRERAAQGERALERLRALESGETARELRRRVADLEAQLAEQTLRAQRAERRAARLEQARESGPVPVTAVAAPLVPQPCTTCEAADDCSRPDLCGRQVLCVGGLSGASEHYRVAVERCNGRFLHHDGGLEQSKQRLHGLLSRADLVVCPADCVSHDAYWRVKRYCKENGKPCLMLRSAGVSSFEKALQRLASSAPTAPGDPSERHEA